MKGPVVPLRKLAILPIALAVLGLAACSFDAGPTVSGGDATSEPDGVESSVEESSAEESSPPADESTSPPPGVAELEIPADRLATAAEDSLEEQMGTRPEIDCGTGINIMIYADRVIYCDLTDPTTGSVYTVTNTITGIDGNQFTFDIAVDETPK